MVGNWSKRGGGFRFDDEKLGLHRVFRSKKIITKSEQIMKKT